jgi:phosphate transport system permease protein
MRPLSELPRKGVRGRRIIDRVVMGFAWIAALLGIGMMTWVIVMCIQRGIEAWNLDFFTQLPKPAGEEGGGIANAIVGTIVMTAMAACMGVPLGFFAGVYLSEFGRHGRIAHAMRLVINVMMGVPSIIVGLFVYEVLVLTMGNYSGYAGAVALAIIMLPVMARATDDILSLVPNELRESSLAVGSPRWRATLGVVCRAARNGLLTGAILAVVRVGGETAPLLFTSLNSAFWTISPDQPYANLTVTIYQYASSPYPDLVEKAWGAALLVIVGVLGANVIVRLIAQRGARWSQS